MGEAELRPREDMEIRCVYSHSKGNGCSGGITLWGIKASNYADALRPEDLCGVIPSFHHAHPSNLNELILDWKIFAEEDVDEVQHEVRNKSACRTSPTRLASVLKAN